MTKQYINTGENTKKNGGKQKFASISQAHLVSRPSCYLSEAAMVHFRFRLRAGPRRRLP